MDYYYPRWNPNHRFSGPPERREEFPTVRRGHEETPRRTQEGPIRKTGEGESNNSTGKIVIDLTLDEPKEQNSGGSQLSVKRNATPSQPRPASQQRVDGFSSSSTQHRNAHASRRPNQPSTYHQGTDKEGVISATPRNWTTLQATMDRAEFGRTSCPSLKPRTATPTVPKSHVSEKVCTNCLEVGVSCDGERPCSACIEPGLLCRYPGDKLNFPVTGKLASRPAQSTTLIGSRSRGFPGAASTPGNALTHLSSTTSLTVSMTTQSDLLPNRLLSGNHLVHGRETLKTSTTETPFLDSDGSDEDDVNPLEVTDFDEVKRLLKKHEARMRDHRAYLLQPLLNQSKLDAAKSLEPDRPTQGLNPFQNITLRTKPLDNEGSSKPSTLQVQTKSHKLGAPKKWTQLSVPLKSVDTNPVILPKYKSIGRLGSSLLAPNIRTLKYWPYFPDEENLDPSEAKKNEELEERYQHDDNHLLAQRKCSELVDMWRPWVKDFVSKLRIEFSDIFYWFLNTTERSTCDTCERDILADAFSEVSQLLNKPTERSLSLARLAVMAVKDVAKISMWHFVLVAPSVKDLLRQIEPSKRSSATLCSVCFLHNCLSHGAYQEPEESGGAVIMGGNVEIDDEESGHNVRLAVSIPNRTYEGCHQCSLYCVAAEARVKDILGRNKNGVIGGIHNNAIHVPRLSFTNDVECSESCYWSTEKRHKFGTVLQTKDYQPKLSSKSKDLFKQLIHIYSDNQRAPCMIAKEIDELTCIDAFYGLLAETQRVSHYRQVVANAAQQSNRKVSKLATGLDTSLSAELDERPPFIPCSHTGSCLNNPDCTCAQNKIHCEWFCGCDKSCERRFPGCKCASANKTCFNDKSCECWKNNRECDPWVCGTCGILEVLDPQNKYSDKTRKGRCRNNRIQLELPARTVKAPSEVQGWGLYAGADLEENAFIGEYKGETVGNQESDRRGAVYANIGQEYLFVMNRDQQIDGSNFGNKTRFINNSQRDDYINVFAKKLLCNGIQRVMLYTKKPIKAGEELLYNYNYPASVTKKFWERGEGPTNVPGAVVAKPSITWTQPRVNGRHAKVAGEQSPAARKMSDGGMDVEDDDSKSKKDTKRKRAPEGDPTHGAAGEPEVVNQNGSKDSHGKVATTFPDDPDDSDYELVNITESSGSVDEASAESDPSESSKSARRRRVVHAGDRRRGGLAQAKAWETRRKRIGKGK